ncbi:MAG: amidase [Deltaproteobacteria bacterium]|nr:amidase [Deltaproteobacteria bacterium]
MQNEICELGVWDLAGRYRRGELLPSEVIDAHLQRCQRLNPLLNAFVTLLPESAREAAAAADKLFRAGVDLGPLQGVPVSVKDLIRVHGTGTTAGSRILLAESPDRIDAVVVQRIRRAGAIVIGKTNLYEFAFGNPEPDGPFGLVQNPRRVGHHPGGSSSGAGAAVASGLGVIGLGTDTGGSIRIPAYICGVSGLKPTTGRISLDGVIPLSWGLDTAGPLARRVSDVAMAWSVCAAREGIGSGAPSGTAERNFLDRPVRGWRVGIPEGKFFSKVQPAVRAAFENTRRLLGDLGCQLIPFDPPEIEAMPELVHTILLAEGAAYHERFRGREDLYGPDLRQRISLGREITALAYLGACRRALDLKQKWMDLKSRFDVLVTPSGPMVAPAHGVATIEIDGEHFPFRDLLGCFTRPFNLLGWPALSVPNGLDGDGLPTGVQIAGPPDSEMDLFILGYRLEQELGIVEKLGIEPRIPLIPPRFSPPQ